MDDAAATMADKEQEPPPEKRSRSISNSTKGSQSDATATTHGDPRYNTIREYMSRNVEGQPLPEKYKATFGEADKSYCPLILDGASGVGKTQQAFALLKSSDAVSLVYVLMSDSSGSMEQEVYREMRRFTNMKQLGRVLESAMEEARKLRLANVATNNDPYAMDLISEALAAASPPADRAFGGLEDFLRTRVLTRHKESTDIGMRTVESLSDVVLFIDEALPWGSSTAKDAEECYNKLRFFRNFGRASGMRVVLAGTAATAATMFTLRRSSPRAASRHEAGEIACAEIAFLSPQLSLTNCGLTKVRPLVASWLEQEKICTTPTDNQFDPKLLLGCLHMRLRTTETSIGNKNGFTWLTGAYLLAEAENVSTPVCVSASELVRSHFFEPAVMLNSSGNIYLGRGVDKICREQGPMRLRMLKRFPQDLESSSDSDNLFWALMASKGRNVVKSPKAVAAGVSPHFRDIEYALSHCVQQCLALEPPLAAALSLRHNFTPEKFRLAVCSTFPETLVQRTKGGLDGELNELVMFAALQLACRSPNKEAFVTQSVSDFITKLDEYLKNKGEAPNFELFENDLRPHEENPQTPKPVAPAYRPPDGQTNSSWEKRDRDVLENEKVPWLVPACSVAKLKVAVDTYGSELFRNIDIAGLTPGGVTTRTDAKAVSWETCEVKWAFEFRARVNCSVKNGREDLMEKCKDSCYHCMLVASTNHRHSTCEFWTQNNQGKFLRVVLIVGNKR